MMRNVAVFVNMPSERTASAAKITELSLMQIKGHQIICGLIDTPVPYFDPTVPEFQDSVLVKIKAFSLNYRDEGLINMVIRNSKSGFFAVGSEFCAEVLACGKNVSAFTPGDRVMGNNHYTDGNSSSHPNQGVPTNHASTEIQVFHHGKLTKVPPTMTDTQAAAFSIGAQTAYSMVRKLELKPGNNILVTAARANTSLFSIAALSNHPVDISVLTTSGQFDHALKNLGVKQIFRISPATKSFLEHEQLQDFVGHIGGFDGVIDPFYDYYLEKVLPLLNSFGRYTSCGVINQGACDEKTLVDLLSGMQCLEIIKEIVFRNISLIGNCLGLTQDLECALTDFSAGHLQIPVDTVYQGPNQVSEFLHRTYNAPDRFGKVIYQYD